jgi:hypothetical protein
MGVLLFQKTLFRVAHSWAVHIDTQEYVELLKKLYDRITVKRVTRGKDGSVEMLLPTIWVDIKQPTTEEEEEEWDHCPSDEEDDPAMYEYNYVEESANVSPTKLRRIKNFKKGDQSPKVGVITGRDPIIYDERVEFFSGQDAFKALTPEDVQEEMLGEMRNIYPLGYATQQFLVKVKNDVQASFTELRERKQKEMDESARNAKEEASKFKHKEVSYFEQDPGKIRETGHFLQQEFRMHDHVNGVAIKTIANVVDTAYN